MEITVSPTQLAEEIMVTISAGLVPYVTSSPGMGKSSIVAQVAKMGKLKMIDLRLSQCMPEDLQGFPMRNGDKATFTPFDMFPLEGEEIPEGYDGWLLLLDELSSAGKQTQAAAYKLILDKMVGSYNLHPACAMVAAGNKASDKAVVVKMSTALQSRLVHYELEVSHRDWMDWAIDAGIDYRITGFIEFKPNALMDFNPDHTDKTFSCPRTLEMLSSLVIGRDVSNAILPRVAGTIGKGQGVEFIAFAEEFDRLPSFSKICTDPDAVEVPKEPSTKFATISMLMEKHADGDMDNILKYLKRFAPDFQIIFARGVNAKSPRMRSDHKGFSQFLLSILNSLK
jgi:hypothetical protein